MAETLQKKHEHSPRSARWQAFIALRRMQRQDECSALLILDIVMSISNLLR